jgi:hypothetical protein
MVSHSGEGQIPQVKLKNISSYLAIQSSYMGIPNFISKTVPLASHINIKLFGDFTIPKYLI